MSMVICLPTQETRDRIDKMFLSPPVAIDTDTFYVQLSPEDVDLTSETFVSHGPYTARFIEFRAKAGQTLNETHLVMELVGVLDCPEMAATARSYGVPENFELRLVFARPAPPHSRTNKSFLVSIADSLVLHGGDFTFTSDLVVS